MNRWIAGPLIVGCIACMPAAAAAASPAVLTQPATSISNTKATLNATVNPAGRATAYVFQYGTTTAYGAQTAGRSAGSGTATVKVRVTVARLTPGTVHHFRIVAFNSAGSSIGADRAFRTTGHPPPAVLTGPAVATSRHGATLTGLVNPMGLVTSYRFQFGLSALYSLQTNPISLAAANAIEAVSFPLSALQSHRLYHYRLVAASTSGTTAGADRVFTTGRFAALGLTRNARPRRLRSRPFALTVTGRLLLPGGFPPAQACKGRVRIRLGSARRTVANVQVALSGGCRYAGRVTLAPSLRGAIRVRARFLGNALLTPRSARIQRVRVG